MTKKTVATLFLLASTVLCCGDDSGASAVCNELDRCRFLVGTTKECRQAFRAFRATLPASARRDSDRTSDECVAARDCGTLVQCLTNLPPNAGVCTNSCNTNNDNECDDGGSDAEFDTCDFATDCDDCGAR